ncbi:hypothetical protein CCACVL1_07612 [Corchorus capsularis]|uniref:Uncharacterized protein n=1 Tax=Corchorus capsularis TaxID=210143 RepID=A0A1R3J4S8_COCAP|nr:hypothetical protein CCACVL1_07612 [Corchorus capsularis]
MAKIELGDVSIPDWLGIKKPR